MYVEIRKKLESQFLYKEIRSENMKGKEFGRVHGWRQKKHTSIN